MVCAHLRELEQALQAMGLTETYRGRAWSKNCREWVYFDCFIDRQATRELFEFEACVRDHTHFGIKNGQEAGFVCYQCFDAIMGHHRKFRLPETPVFPPADQDD